MKTGTILLMAALFSLSASASEATLTEFLKSLQGTWHGQDQVNTQDSITFYDLTVVVSQVSPGVWSAKNTQIDSSEPGAVYQSDAGLHVTGNQLSIAGADGSLKTVHLIATTATTLTYSVDAVDPNSNHIDTITSEMDFDLHGVLHGHNTIVQDDGTTIQDETFTLNK